MSLTRILRPRRHGRPPHWFESTVIRDISLMAFPYDLEAVSTPIGDGAALTHQSSRTTLSRIAPRKTRVLSKRPKMGEGSPSPVRLRRPGFNFNCDCAVIAERILSRPVVIAAAGAEKIHKHPVSEGVIQSESVARRAAPCPFARVRSVLSPPADANTRLLPASLDPTPSPSLPPRLHLVHTP